MTTPLLCLHIHNNFDSVRPNQNADTGFDWDRYPHKDMKECVQLAVGCFGKERVMWGTGCMSQSCFHAHLTLMVT